MRPGRDPRWLVLALPLLLVGCKPEPYTGFDNPEGWTSADCLACHGTRTSGDGAEALEADIVDTHYDDQYLGEDGALYTIENVAGDGFILDPDADWSLWFPPGTVEQENPPGYVVEGAANQCSAGCHDAHDENSLVREQYSNSSHADRESHWMGLEWDGFPTSVCFQCHSSAGFALFTDPTTPSWRPPDYGRPHTSDADEPKGDLITCNTCHLGDGMPTGRNPRLRLSGEITLTSGSGGPPPNTLFIDGTVDAGRSAVCMGCHSGRQSGGSLYKAMVNKGADPYNGVEDAIAGQQFIESHYQPAGATLFSLKAYELPGKTYTAGNLFHQSAGCIGCHMPDSELPDLGGHSLKASRRGGVRDNVTCRECHGSSGRVWGQVDQIGPHIDVDGDGRAEAPIEELEGLYEAITAALEVQGIYYNPDSFPYAFRVPPSPPPGHIFPNRALDWTESQMIAGFNLHYFSHDTGVHVHNFNYAAQVLRDSLEALTGTPLPGVRPTTSYDRPAINYAR